MNLQVLFSSWDASSWGVVLAAGLAVVAALLLHRGRFLDAALRAERVTREEVLAVLRSNGVDDPASVAAVVLETDGSFSVLESSPEAPTLRNVAGERLAAKG